MFLEGRDACGAKRRDQRKADAQQLDLVERVRHGGERTREEPRAWGPGFFGW